jgi:hypothetical protein
MNRSLRDIYGCEQESATTLLRQELLMTGRPSLSDTEIVDRCKSGALVLDLDRWDLDETNPASIIARCVALHNAGEMDFLGLVNTAEFAALNTPLQKQFPSLRRLPIKSWRL